MLAAVLLAGCGGQASASHGPTTSGAGQAPSRPVHAQRRHAKRASAVTIRSFAYTPKVLTVSPGTTVVFTNDDTTNHTVTADDGQFDLGNLSHGASARHRFTKPGTYTYHCTYHPFMHGTIVVK